MSLGLSKVLYNFLAPVNYLHESVTLSLGLD